jgi:UPF0716 protein FxsA
MALIVLAVIIGVPVVEIYAFVAVGEEIGAVPTIVATLATAAAGIALFRSQGRGLAARAQESLDRGEMPLAEVIDAIGLAMAGVFLLIPGFVTDAIGFLLFMPPLRVLLVGWLLKRVLASPNSTVWVARGARAAPRGRGHGAGGPVIDGDFEDVTRDPEAAGAGAADAEPNGGSDAERSIAALPPETRDTNPEAAPGSTTKPTGKTRSKSTKGKDGG